MTRRHREPMNIQTTINKGYIMKALIQSPLRILLLVLPVLIAVNLQSCSSVQANSETEFWVRGNCDMCKKTIETALVDVEGVSSAEYDLDHNTAKISFDSSQTNQSSLMNAVAAAGYDTKTVTADANAYEDLPKCCKKVADM